MRFSRVLSYYGAMGVGTEAKISERNLRFEMSLQSWLIVAGNFLLSNLYEMDGK